MWGLIKNSTGWRILQILRKTAESFRTVPVVPDHLIVRAT